MHEVRHAARAGRSASARVSVTLPVTLVAMLAMACASGCGDDGAEMPDANAGGGPAAGGGGPDTMPDDATFAAVVTDVFDVSCANFPSCHDGNGAPAGGLDLATDPYTALVNAASPGAAGRTLVIPNDPENSYLYEKITSAMPQVGARMPVGFELEQYKVDLIRAWIMAGAPNN